VAETLTPTYGWTKPDPGASPNTWGATLNATTDKIDAQVAANAARGIEIGSGAIWFTATPPANWLICDGSSLPITAPYDKLFAVIGYAWGGSGANFNLPPLVNKFPYGGNLTGQGGEANHTLTPAEMPVHAHGVSDPTHAHAVYDPTHIHGVGDPGHAHGAYQDAHSHGLDHNVGSNFSGGNFAAGVNWAFGPVRTDAQQPPVHVNAAGTGLYLGYAATGIGIYGAGTGIGIQNAGSGGAHNNMPPWVGVNFIIKYQ
jgi:microcystin-dependent protein